MRNIFQETCHNSETIKLILRLRTEADKLMMENISKNLIDQDEYPQMVNIHSRCISMLAHLWKAPHSKDAIGTATTGSSEAIMLGGLAMKKNWRKHVLSTSLEHVP